MTMPMSSTPGMKMKCSGPGVFIGRVAHFGCLRAASSRTRSRSSRRVAEARLLAPDERHPDEEDDPESPRTP